MRNAANDGDLNGHLPRWCRLRAGYRDDLAYVSVEELIDAMARNDQRFWERWVVSDASSAQQFSGSTFIP